MSNSFIQVLFPIPHSAGVNKMIFDFWFSYETTRNGFGATGVQTLSSQIMLTGLVASRKTRGWQDQVH